MSTSKAVDEGSEDEAIFKSKKKTKTAAQTRQIISKLDEDDGSTNIM